VAVGYFKILLQHSTGGINEIQEKDQPLYKYSASRQKSNQGHPAYEAGVPTTQNATFGVYGVNVCARDVPQLRRLVASFPPRRPGFEHRSVHVEFMVDKVALGHVFSEYFDLPCQFSFHRLLHTHHHHPGLIQAK
jgi:hypothetical protein